MKIPKYLRRKQTEAPSAGAVQTAPRESGLTVRPQGWSCFAASDLRLYDTLRESVPIIDASIAKIIRLVGGFEIHCSDPSASAALDRFVRRVPVGGGSVGLESFLQTYLSDLLTYGGAVGEIVFDQSGRRIAGLYNGSLYDIELRAGSDPMRPDIWVRDGLDGRPVEHRERVFYTALHPRPGELAGQSLLRGLPFVSNILLRIYEATGQNFERIGNVRYAVTYRPQGGELDRSFAKERAQQISAAWSQGMAAAKEGRISDFVCVGDVNIQAIGADTPLLDTNVPVRQMLEQIIAKLGIPPFLLGLNWSTTERMSKQQADILTSELASYRRLLEPILLQICETFLRLEGWTCSPQLEWSIINLQDEGEMAKARLNNAQADKIYAELSSKEADA